MTKQGLPARKQDRNAAHDGLDRAAFELLDRLPLRWKVIDIDGMTAAEQAQSG